MNPLVLSFLANADWEYAKPWFSSLKRSGYSGEIALVTMGCQADLYENCSKHGIRTFEADPETALGLHGFNLLCARFLLQGRVLQESYPDRLALVTDVRDVFFQGDPFGYLSRHYGEADQKKLFLSPEEVTHDHESMPGRWNAVKVEHLFSKRVREEVKGRTVYNAGVICGPSALLAGVFELIYLICFRTDRPGGDQAAFNMMLPLEPFKSESIVVPPEAGWAAHFAALQFSDVPEEKKPRIEDGLVKTRDGTVIEILHQYDRSREVRRLISARLADWAGEPAAHQS